MMHFIKGSFVWDKVETLLPFRKKYEQVLTIISDADIL